jgi:GTPase
MTSDSVLIIMNFTECRRHKESNTMQFIDHAKIIIESGAGGDGIVSWRREKFVAYGGPAGGDGGRGGDVILEATTDLQTLLDFRYQSRFLAGKGEKGRNKSQHGKYGDDLIIKVPCGTVVYDADDRLPIADLTDPGSRYIVAVGGRGGRGNGRFASSSRQTPHFAEPGEPGITRELDLELKLIADVGLLGFPNAGKSTLISVLSSAKPKIADYPFTTLVPNLGVVRQGHGDGFVMADIPGLIAGASQGVGLGHEFLRHVERTRLLLHLLDISAPELSCPIEAYQTINQELAHYSEIVSKKPQIIVLTKQDAASEASIETYQRYFESQDTQHPVFLISSVAQLGTEALKDYVTKQLSLIPREDNLVEVIADTKAYQNDDSAFEVVREGLQLFVIGGKIERLMRVTDVQNQISLRRTMNILKAMGVFEALKQQDATEADSVVVAGYSFDYYADDV